jgi:streptogramin lyase
MNLSRFVCAIASAVIFAQASPASAQIWEERANAGADAEDLPQSAQIIVGQGPLRVIGGEIDNVDLDIDMFCLTITDPASFSATYTHAGGGAQFRPFALWLFDSTGRPVAHATDNVLPYVARIDGTHIPSAGRYYLAIAGPCWDPRDGANTPLFPPIFFGQTAGNPIAGPIASWAGSGCFDGGAYAIQLTGAEACTPPQVGGPDDPGPWWTYFDPEHFSQGYLFNLSVTIDPATGLPCLQLNNPVEAWPFVAAPASARGSLMRVAVEDLPQYSIREGDVLGEYWSRRLPSGATTSGGNPSRTTVDPYGNIWITNRGDNVNNASGVMTGSVLRVGLVLGGERVDATGRQDASGDYLKGPFQYCTCEDRDNDTLIKTSRGYPRVSGSISDYQQNRILPWPPSGGPSSGVSDAEDECITAWTRVAGTGARFVALDPSNDIWVGGWDFPPPTSFEKLDGATATQSVPAESFAAPYGYGGFVDPNNVLWISEGYGVKRYDATTRTLTTVADAFAYGIALDPDTCDVWSHSGQRVYNISPSGILNASFDSTNSDIITGGGIAVLNGQLWLAGYGNYVGRMTPGPTSILFSVHLDDPPHTGNGPWGVSVDRNDKVWAFNQLSNNLMRIDPSVGFGGVVDLTVSMGAGAGPYSYSDSTGRDHLTGSAPQGSWTFIHDSGKPGARWGTLDWTSTGTPGTRVLTRVRASDGTLPSGAWTDVSAGVEFTGVTGRYLQVQVTLARPADCIGGGDICLFDLTICEALECAAEVEEALCVRRSDGTYDLSLSLHLVNNTAIDATRVRITPVVGSSLGFTPHTIDVSIPAGQSGSVQTVVSGWADVDEFCFYVTLLGADGEECCSTLVCHTHECECLQIPRASESVAWIIGGIGDIADFINMLNGWFWYSFSFDNLTDETIYHVYLDPPPGVTFEPSYIQFPGGIPPGGSSGTIQVFVKGAPLGQAVDFNISIHNEDLEHCCTRAWRFLAPSFNLFGDLGDFGDWTAMAMTNYNPGWGPSSDITLSITNTTDEPAAFNWAAVPMPVGGRTTFGLPPDAIEPPSGTTPMLPPGASWDVVFSVPGGLVPANQIAGVRAGIFEQATGAPLGIREAQILGVPEFEMDGYVTRALVRPVAQGVQLATIGQPVSARFELINDGPRAEVWLWRAHGSDYYVSLNGEAPGVFAGGEVHLDPGESVIVEVLATLEQDPGTGVPVSVFSVKPEGFYPPHAYLASTSFRTNGSCRVDLAPPFGVLDLADIVAYITAFTSADPFADLAEPFGVFDLADIVAFIDAFGAGCP